MTRRKRTRLAKKLAGKKARLRYLENIVSVRAGLPTGAVPEDMMRERIELAQAIAELEYLLGREPD